MRYTGEPLCPSVAVAEAGIRAYPDWELYGFGRWAAWHRAEDRIIGFAGLKYLVDIAEVDLGYRFFPEYWDIGLATEASLACVKYGFETLGLNRIIGLVLPENQASVRVLQKAGMVSEGPMSFDGEEVELFAIGASSYRRGP
jgi:RimJ/RimL family protein N-acetyltransferase